MEFNIPFSSNYFNYSYIINLANNDIKLIVAFSFLAMNNHTKINCPVNTLRRKTLIEGKLAKEIIDCYCKKSTISFPNSSKINFAHPLVFTDKFATIQEKYNYLRAISLLSYRRRFEYYIKKTNKLTIPKKWYPSNYSNNIKYITFKEDKIHFKLEEQLLRRQ